jgi:hypothetical protein
MTNIRLSGTDFSALRRPGVTNGSLTRLQLVGKNSPNEDTPLYEPDWNNFAPAVGFSWALSYFGKNKTVLRGGFGMGYERNSLRIVDIVAGDQPGLRTLTTFAQTSYLNLARVGLPLTPAGQPLELVPLTDRNQTVRAGAGLRSNSNTQGFFNNNNVGGFANYLNTTANYGARGLLLRNAGLPENWIVANPQFVAASLTSNFANSTYHSLQLEVNKRFSNGFLFQSNYTWSKALGEEEGSSQEQLDSYRDALNRRLDKRLLSFHTPHVWRNNGIWELPFGPGRKFLSSSPAIIARLVERWQFGVIYNLFSGSPLALTAPVTSFNNFAGNTPVPVGDLPRNLGKVQKVDNGVIFFPGLTQVTDPSVANITTSQDLRSRSTMLAIADASGKVLLVNAQPGQVGVLQEFYLQGPGSFRLDMNLVKRFKIREEWNFEFRADVIGLTNTPQFSDYSVFNTDINSTNFGRITGAAGTRLVVLGLRLNF